MQGHLTDMLAAQGKRLPRGTKLVDYYHASRTPDEREAVQARLPLLFVTNIPAVFCFASTWLWR